MVAKHDFIQVINSGTYATYGRSLYKPGLQYREVSRWDPHCTLPLAPSKRSNRSCSAGTVDALVILDKHSAWHKCHTREDSVSGQGNSSTEPWHFYPSHLYRRRQGHKGSAHSLMPVNRDPDRSHGVMLETAFFSRIMCFSLILFLLSKWSESSSDSNTS